MDPAPRPFFSPVLAWMAAVAVAAVAGVQLLPWLTWDSAKLAAHGFLIDDAFFYTVVARNFWEAGFPTFDGSMPTNGFQPLWMALQVAFAGVFPRVDPVRLLTAASWACYVLFAGLSTGYLVRRLPARAAVPGAAVFAGLVLLQANFQRLVMKGLEVPLLLLLLPLFLAAIDRVDRRLREPGARVAPSMALLGVLSALVFLARTDLFWAPVVAFAWLLLRQRRPFKVFGRDVILFGFVVAALVLPYLAFNLAFQGSLMPISGRVKLFYLETFYPTLASYWASTEWLGVFGAFDRAFGLAALPGPAGLRYAGVALLFGLAQAWVWRQAGRGGADGLHPSLKVLTAIVLLHSLYLHLAYRELRPYTAYYFAPEIVWIACVAVFWTSARIHGWTGSRRARLTALPLLLLAVALPFTTRLATLLGRDTTPSRFWMARLELARDIGRSVPPGESIGAWWPGLFAEYGGRPVVPLDGIIGSREYFRDHVRTGRELDYLRKHGVRFVAILLRDGAPWLRAGAHDAAGPAIADWADLGERRLFEARASIRRVVAVRDAGGDRAWYLLELSEIAPR